jgi:hypothetical protein
MEKLLDLEKKLKEAKEMLKNALMGYSPISKAEDKDEEKKEEKKDEKKDKKMIAGAIDKHNEKKHGEDKDEDSAQKDMGLKKGLPGNKFGAKVEQDRESSTNAARQPATLINPKTGSKSVIAPKEQVKAQIDSAAEKKGKAETEAAARRMAYRKDGVLKSEVIKFDKNGQWSMDKADDENC